MKTKLTTKQKTALRALFAIDNVRGMKAAGFPSLHVFREALRCGEAAAAGVPGVTLCSDAADWFSGRGFRVGQRGVGYIINP